MRGVGLSSVLVIAVLAGCSAEGDAAGGRASTSGRTSAATGTAATSGGRPGLAGSPGVGQAGSPSWAGQQPGVMQIAGGPAPASGPTTGLPMGTCASGLADTAPVTPVIWLVVDGSSSMNQEFAAGSNRWDTLRSTLMDPGGIVDSLQTVAEFGLVIYSGGSSDPNQCVQLVTVQPALNNHAALSAMYPTTPLGMGTPTDKALDHVVTTLPTTPQQMLDARGKPIYVVLATDGQPNDACDGGGRIFGGGGRDDATVRQDVIGVTTKGTQAGMQMYVISLAGGDQQLQSHLEQVAMATASKTPPFVPASQNDLVATFRDIVGSASCQIDLKGEVMQGKECAGKVTLNGTDLECGSSDGWRLLDKDTFELTGMACNSFTSTPSTVAASFPCEVFVPE